MMYDRAVGQKESSHLDKWVLPDHTQLQMLQGGQSHRQLLPPVSPTIMVPGPNAVAAEALQCQSMPEKTVVKLEKDDVAWHECLSKLASHE